MTRFVASQLRHRAGRSIALLLGIVMATTAFVVLTSSADTQRLEVVAKTQANFRGAYDILVRPAGTQSATEKREATVAPGFLNGIGGGITVDQWRHIEGLNGVDVAAPVAMVGYVMPQAAVSYDLTKYLNPGTHSVFRTRVTWKTDRGLTTIEGAPQYMYVSRGPLSFDYTDPDAPTRETLADGSQVPVCQGRPAPPAKPFPQPARYECTSLAGPNGDPHVTQRVLYGFPTVIAAIDPQQEAKLDGLDGALTSGRYLHELESLGSFSSAQGVKFVTLPVLASSKNYLDDDATVTIQRLDVGSDAPMSTWNPSALAKAKGQTVVTRSVTADDGYRLLLKDMQAKHDLLSRSSLTALWQIGGVAHTAKADGALAAKPVENPPDIWKSYISNVPWISAPPENADAQFRAVKEHLADMQDRSDISTIPEPQPRAVGIFAPAKVRAFNDLTKVPLGIFEPTAVTGADDASRAALGGKTLAPNGNLGGFVAQAPQLITTISALEALHKQGTYTGWKHADDPISAIRVRVTGVTGPGAVSRERVRLVAQEIAKDPNLQVDITVGSSPVPTAVELPAGKFGRPKLEVSQDWVKKGVAVAILSALDHKSLALFALILAVCGLFVANAVSAAVRARRTELGILACLGWPRGRLLALMAGEVAVVGLVAGLIGAGIAVPLANAVDLHVSAGRALLAIPAAVALALVAGMTPVWRASRAHPAAAVRPALAVSRRARHPRGIVGLAAANVLRVPGRTALGAASLAIGACAFTVLLAVTLMFRGAVVGSLLGDAVSLQVRGVDYAAAVAIVTLGAFAIADVLYLGIRERAAELSTLRATGWSEGALARLVTYEGALIGAVGTLVGAGVGCAVAAVIAGRLPGELIATAVAVVVAGTAVAAAAAFVPASVLRTLPTAQLLAEE